MAEEEEEEEEEEGGGGGISASLISLELCLLVLIFGLPNSSDILLYIFNS